MTVMAACQALVQRQSRRGEAAVSLAVSLLHWFALRYLRLTGEGEASPRGRRMTPRPQRWSETHQELVEDVLQLGEQLAQRSVVVEEMCDRAQQVAEQMSRPRLCGDVEHDLVEVDLQA